MFLSTILRVFLLLFFITIFSFCGEKPGIYNLEGKWSQSCLLELGGDFSMQHVLEFGPLNKNTLKGKFFFTDLIFRNSLNCRPSKHMWITKYEGFYKKTEGRKIVGVLDSQSSAKLKLTSEAFQTDSVIFYFEKMIFSPDKKLASIINEMNNKNCGTNWKSNKKRAMSLQCTRDLHEFYPEFSLPEPSEQWHSWIYLKNSKLLYWGFEGKNNETEVTKHEYIDLTSSFQKIN